MQAKLLGIPEIIFDGKYIQFPFKKAEALLYYMLVQKKATRDELTGLFWADLKEDTAKKNLRNALYQVKKAIGCDVFFAPNRSEVRLNSEVVYDIDIDIFIKNKDVSRYTGQLMEGLNIKKADGFDTWLTTCREYYRNAFIDFGLEVVEIGLKSPGEQQNMVRLASRVVQADPYDERARRALMQSWVRAGKPHKAVEAYRQLETLLEEELGVEPDETTRELLSDLLEEKSSVDNDQFFGRKAEVSTLLNVLQRFSSSIPQKGILLEGEAGIGKTALVDHVISQATLDDVPVIHVACYQAESGFFLKPLNALMKKLRPIMEAHDVRIPTPWLNTLAYAFPSFGKDGTITGNHGLEQDQFEQHRLEEMLTVLLQETASRCRFILILEDLQWMDTLSRDILTGMLLRMDRRNILLLGTMRSGGASGIRKLKDTFLRSGIADTLYLSRFNKQEVSTFIEQFAPGALDNVHRAFSDTEGNPFFLREWIRNFEMGNEAEMTPGMLSVFESRYQDICSDAQKLVDLAACFSDRIDYSALQGVNGKSDMDLLEWIEELQEKNILKEGRDKHIRFTFTHQKLRDFVYERMGPAKKKILHRKIAAWYENNHVNIRPTARLEKLMHHWVAAAEPLKALIYRLQYFEGFLAVEHELYPIVETAGEKRMSSVLDRHQVSRWFDNQRKQLHALSDDGWATEDVDEAYLQLYLMEGRYWIQDGQYDKGKRAIHSMLRIAENQSNVDMQLKGYRQLVNCGVQLSSASEMAASIKMCFALLSRHENREEEALVLRLRGLQRMLEGKLALARDDLKLAIERFKSLDRGRNRYGLNIAACYNYLGDLARLEGDSGTALSNYEIALEISALSPIEGGGAVFATNAGQTAFEVGNYDESFGYLEQAVSRYNESGTLWKRSVAECYLAMIAGLHNNVQTCFQHLIQAREFMLRLKSPYEKGVYHRALALVADLLDKELLSTCTIDDGLVDDFIAHELKSFEEHKTTAQGLLKQSGALFELTCIDGKVTGYK